MTHKVHQCDRDAAADFLKGDGHAFDSLWHPQVRAGERDDHVIVRILARHREAAEARIIAWLRSFDGDSEWKIANGEYVRGSTAHGEDLQREAWFGEAADAIERSEHLEAKNG